MKPQNKSHYQRQKKDQPFISVIIPVYNVEKYLPQCMKSVVNQTFREIEIICVNDGSTDSCLKILQDYAQKDERIKIINQENMGLSAARNSGLKIARAEYIFFIDSDDWIDDNTLEILYDTAIKTNTDLTCCHFTAFSENLQNSKYVKEKQQYFDMSIQTTDRCFSLADNPLKIHVVVNGKLHKKSIIKKYNLTFPNRRLIHEDEYWAWIYGIYCNKCIYLSKGLYHYRIHPNSITRTEENTPNSLDIIDIDTLIANFLQQKELLSKYIFQLENIFLSHLTVAVKRAGLKLYPLARQKMAQYLDIPYISDNFKKNIRSLLNSSIPVSVIIPIFNTAQYLPKCIDSVLTQSFSAVEVICINDGSTDKSFKILESYAKSDPRIRIINQKNQGASVARNNGLKIAQGKYILFLDSDDWYEAETIEKIFTYMQQFQSDIIHFRLQMFDSAQNKTYTNEYFNLPTYLPYLSNHNIEENINFLVTLPQEIGNKAYLRNFLIDNNICFYENITLGEDELFNLQCLLHAKSYTILKEHLYNYRHPREGSIVSNNKKRTFTKFMSSHFQLLDRIVEMFGHQNNTNYKKALLLRYIIIINQFFAMNPILENANCYKTLRTQLLKNKLILFEPTVIPPATKLKIDQLMYQSWSNYRSKQICMKIKESKIYKKIKTVFNFVLSYFLFPWYIYKIYKMLKKERSKK